jgi:hypothetical protein
VGISAAFQRGLAGNERTCPYDADLERQEFEEWCKGFVARYSRPRTKTRRGKIPPKIAAIDFETDPFSGPGNGDIRPFVGGYFDGDTYAEFWGEDCAERLVAHIKSKPYPVIAYAHNGGKFDFTFLLDWLEPNVFTIGTRIVRAWLLGDKLQDGS